MLKRSLAIGSAVAALSLASPAAQANEEPVPPGKVTVNVVTVNGSGCPAGTAAVSAASDNTAFTVSYSDYLASRGPGISPTEFRKNCQLNLRINVPQGFTYAIARADYRGFAHLARGAYAQERASYYFQGQAYTTRSTHTFIGPFSNNWQTSDKVEYTDLVWAPCGEVRNLNLNTELRVYQGTSSPDSTSFLAMDSTDGSVSTRYQFAWKQCPKD